MATPSGEIELTLLRESREPLDPRRLALCAVGSLLFHAAVIVFVGSLPSDVAVRETPFFIADIHKAVPLYVPKELTQRDPNRGKITNTLDVRSTAPPAPIPQAPSFRQPVPLPPPVASIPPIPEPPKVQVPNVEQTRLEAPKIETTEPRTPPTAGRAPQAPPQVTPQVAPPPEKPKLAFEKVGAGGPLPTQNPNPNSALRLPSNLAEEAARLGSQGSSGAFVGDLDDALPTPGSANAPGPSRSNLQLLSDPKGVDFKPYLIQVLASVRSNWLAVIPDAARRGRKGRVLVQFIIDKRGGVPKLVIAESSGTAAFDRAAVAGISASNPFPPLPTTFQGSEIRLQLAFTYNVPQ